MKRVFGYRLLLPSAVLSLGLVYPAFAQSDNGVTASEQMNSAGEQMNEAGSEAGSAVKHAYHGTVIALHDAKITAMVKSALHRDDATEHSDIHVSTSAGVVTLRGSVPSADIAQLAERIAQNSEGVKDVKNKLEVSNQPVTD